MKPLSFALLVVFVVLVGRAQPPKPAEPAARVVEFNRDVRPILSDACFACHGFDPKARKAKLRLDTPEGAFAEREGTFPIKPGDPKKSEVWRRIVTDEADAVMPPPHTNKKLTAAQKETLRLWVEQGAKYQKHWAFEAITRPNAPQGTTPVDAFLIARLQKEGLRPTPEADRATLVRRVSFALTGLPPSLKELDDFLADAAPNSYERMVDRYLASPRYGEEMARHWLDVARYAEDQAHTFGVKPKNQAWRYRDWVIAAFNSDMPYDQFVKLQIAGDMLTDAPGDPFTKYAGLGFLGLGAPPPTPEWGRMIAESREFLPDAWWYALMPGIAIFIDEMQDVLPEDVSALCAACHELSQTGAPLIVVGAVAAAVLYYLIHAQA